MRVGHAVIALGVSAAVLVVFAAGYGPVPALGRPLGPGNGAWASAGGGALPRSQTLTLPGLGHPVSVVFSRYGVPSIAAASESDAFAALGYLHARFRLTEMDLERRLGAGRVAALAGPAGLAPDEFELRLGLLRTARQEWAATPRSSPAGQALTGYSRGVNDYLAQARTAGNWPSVVIVAAAGWAAALAWLTLRDGLPEPAVARTIAALAGLPAHAAAGFAVTLLAAAIQAAVGLWLGRAVAPGHVR